MIDCASMPDKELRELVAAGRLQQPEILAQQTTRMLQNERAGALAIEFGTQWIHVRGFDQFNEKNEKLFPTFNAELKAAMYEEAIRFFGHLFRNDAPVTDLLDADYTFLNQTLAEHYGIPDVTGNQSRRVDGVKQFGRGGILEFAAVHTKQAGASRTRPVLRGNWVVETLLGEKLPLPPPNVPLLPAEETDNGGLTMRQMTERHVKGEACAVCHRRIDPFGFALEYYDPIGRLRSEDFGGLPLDAHARVRDGAEFEGIDGLREYLLSEKQDVIVRLFCRRLLGYALRRSVNVPDYLLIDQMTETLKSDDAAGAVSMIVQCSQFRSIRGASNSGDSSLQSSTDGRKDVR